ncbi:YSIRK-type signal peptide-containing protein [uncultured Granulicatella sp.]|uniref:YSIRK-type signal peptide-containing protein n=1 Tax=uncultured Granulicatella sp. TaxID=316089 RepID=UPI0028DCC0BE|nr:YSIRK-type signal peptide-containing protein [uncultured Granulicatella sp.]
MRKNKKENMWNQVQRFSIRKFSFGVTSALLGTFFLANTSMVQAEVESGQDSAVHATKPEEKVGTGKPNENAQPVVATEIKKVETNVVAEETNKASKEQLNDVTIPKVDKSTLSQAIDNLSELLNQVNRKKVSRTSMSEYEGVLSKAKEVYQNDATTQNEVDSQVRKVNGAITIAKSFPKVKSSTGEMITPKTGTDAITEAPKTETEIKHSLETVKEDLQKYVKKSENTTDKPNVTAAEEILESISKQLENPTLSSQELTTLLEKAKTVRNSLVNEELRATSGARDSRNGQNMGEGVTFRADAPINSGALANIKYFASVDPRAAGNNGRNTRNNEPELTLNKTEIKAVYVQDSEGKWIVYDVFFNNDGRKMTGLSKKQHYYFQAPFNIMDPKNVVRDLTFTRYRNVNGTRLSNGFEGFERYGNTAVITDPWNQKYNIFNADSRTFYDPNSGAYTDAKKGEVFKNNKDDSTLNQIVRDKNGNYPKASYYLGLELGQLSTDYAVHMHAKIKLRDNVTLEEANQYGRVFAASVTSGETTNQSYIMGATGTRLTTKTDAQLSPIKGSTHNKTVGDTLPNPDNPVTAKYITPKNGGEFPAGMSWSWKNNIKPSTAEAGVFKYTAVATYQDGSKSDAANSGSDGTVTLNVKPIKPTITANDVVHKKGLANQTITVNVGTGVKNGSTVTLYDGNNVIGTGTTNGTTARITVSGALPGRPITAVTTVNNNGTVTSEKSDGVTPTDAPDNQAPTVKMTNPTDNNKVSVLTSNETNAPTTRIYRGATLNVPLTMYDNDPKGKVNLKYESGLPKGVTFNNGTTLSKTGATEARPGTTNVTGKVAADATLGKQTVTFKVSDDQGNNVDRGNNSTVKFNVEVVDLAFKEGKGTVSDGKLVVKTAKGTSYTDSHDFITTTDGTNVGDQFFAGGMKFRFIDSNGTTTSKVTLNTPGKQIVKAAAYFHDGYAGTNGVEKVTNTTPGKDNEIINRTFLYKTIEFQVKPTAPTVTPETNGDVTVTPVNEENVNTFNFTYKDPNNTPKIVTATKTGNGWTLSNAPADGVTIDRTTGKVTIKDRAIKDSDPVTATSKTNDNVESDPATVNSKVGDNEPPKFKFTPNGKETRVETGKEQVAYITPTEDTNLKIGTVTDNSGKLSEVKFADKSNTVFGIKGLGSGITYNEVVKTNNGDVDAPRDIIVSGKLPERNGNKDWTDDVEITRFVVAKDAALKEMRDQDASISNPTRVKLKVLTQATKYDPHVGNQVIDKDITAQGATVTPKEFDAIKSNITFTSERGDVKISNGANNRTAGLNITMNENGAIQKDPANGSYYVSARIEYPDHSTEDVRIPVTKSDTTAPRVTINGKELSETATDYSFVVFKGSTFNPTLRVSDDKNNVKSVTVSGLPSGNNFSATGDWSKNGADVQVVGDTITATNNATPGDHEASVVVKDALNNEKTYKFKYKVVDVAIRETPKTVPLNTQLGDSHTYVKVVDGANNDGDDKYYPDGMSFKWKKGTAEVADGTRLTRPGIVSDYKPEVKFKSGAGFYTKTIDGKEVKVYTPATIERDQTFRVKPTAPIITPLENGDVTVTPVSEENVNTLNFTYKHPNDSTITVTATKNGNRWSLTSGSPGDGVTINPETGVVSIKDRAIKDAAEVTAKSVTTDSVDSDTTTANSKAGDKEPPVFTFAPDGKEKVVDATGRQVVYVTPTEETDLNIGVVTDNSGKLVQAIFRETNGNTSNGLGFQGLNHNGLPRTDNVEVDAPRNILVTGKVSEYKSGTTPWADTDEYTRGMYARDAATNEIRNTLEHPTNVVFKVLTQATKYEPQVSAQPVNVDVNATSAKISQSDFDALKSNITFNSTRGPVKIDNTTTGLKISMKEEGAIKQNSDGTHYVGATIEYPDHSRDEIQIPVVKADANEPSATMDGMLLTKDENTTANFVVFRGSTFNPTFNVRDDRNNINKINVTGLPNGTSIEKTGSWTSGTNVKITEEANTSTSTADLGERVGEVTITDATGNTGTYKYKYKVVDVEVRNSPETVELGTKLVDAANANNGKDSHNYVKVVDGQNNNGDDKYYPAGMNFKWSKNNAEITTTTEFNKPGVVTDYKALVKFSSGAGFYTKSIDGKTTKVYTPASVEKDVTFHVAPPKPTFNQDAVSSTTRTISGTLGGFNSDDRVVEVHLNDKDNTVLSSKKGQVTINGDTWTATLPDGVNLRQSENKNGETAQPTAITVINKVGDTEVSTRSDEKVVKMGEYSPSATIAGSKHIDITVPHDAKRVELRFHNSADTDTTTNSIVLIRDENGGNWKVDSTTPTGVTNANGFVEAITNSVNETNKAENKVSITLKESDNNKKLLIKEETASGDNTANYTSGLGLRVDYKPESGQDATPAGNWKVISVTNDAPVVTLKNATEGTQENPKVYTAGTSLTAELLKELVTVSDTEDDRATDKPFGTGKVNILSGLPENPSAGVYAVTLQPVDSQGKAGNQVTVHVVVKEEKPAAPTISQWQNGNVKVTPSTDNGGDKVTIPLTDGTVTLVKKDTGWEIETPKEGVVFHNGSLEIPKELVGNNVTAKATKGTNGSAVDSDDATYTPQSHTVTKKDVEKEADSPLSRGDLSGTTGVTGVTDGTETKDFTTAKITSVVEKSPLPNVTPDSKHTIPVTITYEDGSKETTDVIVKVKPSTPTISPKENGSVEITPVLTGEGTTTITYTGEDNTPQTVTLTKGGDGTWTSSDPTLSVDVNGKVTIPADKVKDGSEVTAKVTSKTTELTSQPSTATVGQPLDFTITPPANAIEKAKYTSGVVVTPNKSNSTISAPTVNGLTVNSEGKVTGTPEITDWDGIEDNRDVTIKVTVTHEGDTPVTKDVIVNVLRDTDGDGDPDTTDLDDDNDGIPDEQDKNPKVADKLIGTVNPPEPVREKAAITPVTVVTSNKPGSKITQENPEPVNGLTVNGKGELTGTPKVDDWGKDEEERQIKIPVKVTKEITGKEPEEIKVEVPVTILRDTDGDGTPDKEDADDDNDGIPDDEEKKNGTDPKVPTTQTPTIGITRKENGDAIVTPTKPGGGTYPPGTTVTIPGNDNTLIEVTIGNDGSGTVPNDKLPKGEITGEGTVTEPNKEPSKPVNVTTPARKPSTVELEQDPKTGDVTVTPKKPDGTTYPPGTKVEIPGKNGTPIVVTIEEGGKGKVSNNDLPEDKTPGTGKITENGKDPEDVKVETPKRIDPTLPETDAPTEIAITRKENGDAIVTPKKPGGGTYPPGTKVEIPGEDGTTIEVTIGNDGSGEVPNDRLPKDAKPGTGTVTETNKKPSQPVNVTTPARKTPTVELEQNPNTGDVTVTPKKPGGETYPPGTVVEIPGKDGNPIRVEIGQNGKGTVPNSELPDGNTPGNAKITEPNKPVENVTVETPARKTPTVELQQDPDTGEVTVTPKKPDGTTYPSGTKVEIPGKNGTPIVVTIGEGGKGKVPNKDLPDGNISGPGTITEPGTGKTPEKVTVETPARLTPALVLDQDPNTGDVTVTPKKPDGTTYPPGTTVEIPGKNGVPIVVTTGPDGKVVIPNKDLPDGEIPGTGKITPPGKPSVELEVKTPKKLDPNASQTEQPGKIEITRKSNGDAVVTPKKPDGTTYPPGTKVVIPGDHNTPIEVIIGDNGSGEVPNDKLPKGDLPGKGTVTEPNKRPSNPVDVTTPARKTPTVELEQDPSTGDVTVTPKKPDGSIYPPGTKVEIPGKNGTTIVVTIGEDGKGKVPNKDLPEGDVPGTGKILEPGKPDENVDVTTPSRKTPTVELQQDPDSGDVTVTPKKPDGSIYPPGTKIEIPGKNGTPIVVIIGQDGKGKVPNKDLPDREVPGNAKITEPGKDPVEVPVVTTPAKLTPTVELEQDPNTGDVTVTPKKPDGTTYPPGTKVEIPGKNGNTITVTIGEDGKGKVPNNELPDADIPGTGKITEPGKPTVEVNVKTPKKLDPNAPQTEQPGEIEIIRKPNGDAVVTPKKPDGTTYPPGTKVVIPGDHNTPIEVIIGDNGSGEVPNDKLPKGDLPGKGIVTEPNKRPSNPVDVTTPARKTPTVELEQNPNTGDVTVTPKKPDGSTYPPGTKVEIPGKNGHTITVTIGQDGKGKVPNKDLPDGEVPGIGKITEPGKPTVEVNVKTPKKLDPNAPQTEQPGEIEITRKPNGDAVVTPKKPDGTTYPPGTKVVIPGDHNTPIEVIIGDNGSGEVPNDKLPKGDLPGKGTVTEPNKRPSKPVDVITPARKTPTVELEQDPNTGDVTVTPKKPDGSTYPPGTKVKIPGKNGNTITVIIGEDGKGKVPNSELPDGKVPGTAKITEPGKPTEEVPVVTTPAKLTPKVEVDRNPNTPQTEQPITIEITRKPNGDAVVTPKKPDGSTYPPGTKVLIPGDNNTPIEVIIGENGSGEVPNDKLPKGDLPGKGIVTEPNKRPSNPVDVTTPARKTPTSELEQNPKAGNESETTKDNQTPVQETPSTTGEPVQQTQDTNQNILPNTGTADGLGIFSAAAASILSGLGLVVFGKKEDEEEENN